MTVTNDVRLEQGLRAAMGNLVAGLNVVTTSAGAAPHGTTVSGVMSLSMDPPMVLVSLGVRSRLLARLELGTRIGVNVLAADQDQVALRFSGSAADRFADIPWFEDHGAPRIVDAHAWVAADVESLVPGGDHVIVLGRVVDAVASPGAPLSYHQRTFGTHHPF
ncbi:flavin reductase family protein [Aeromicrobium sp. NPDC092404]|uniref:flavin reductase family protein n=1 Tax=Aeromicrobium sp. NPDC092404 TaxID=3154976 RepID=UPI00343730CC